MPVQDQRGAHVPMSGRQGCRSRQPCEAAPVGFGHFLRRTWSEYWLRGLRLAWRARWPFWVPMLLWGLNATVWLMERRRYFSVTGAELQEFFPAAFPADLGRALPRAARATVPYLTAFPSPLQMGGYAAMLVLFAFSIGLSLRILRSRSFLVAKRLVLPAAVSGAVALAYVIGGSDWPAQFEPWYRAISTRGMGAFLRDQLAVPTVMAVRFPVMLSALAGWLGSLFWLAARGGPVRLSAASDRAADRFWLLVGYFAAVLIPPAVVTYFAGLTGLGVKGLFSEPFSCRPVYFAIFAAARAWGYVGLIGGLPIPFLVISGEVVLRSSLNHVLGLYRRFWKRLLVLWAIVIVPILVLFFGLSLVALWWQGRHFWVCLFFWGASFLRLGLSIGGVMGLFLLIEESRQEEGKARADAK